MRHTQQPCEHRTAPNASQPSQAPIRGMTNTDALRRRLQSNPSFRSRTAPWYRRALRGASLGSRTAARTPYQYEGTRGIMTTAGRDPLRGAGGWNNTSSSSLTQSNDTHKTCPLHSVGDTQGASRRRGARRPSRAPGRGHCAPARNRVQPASTKQSARAGTTPGWRSTRYRRRPSHDAAAAFACVQTPTQSAARRAWGPRWHSSDTLSAATARIPRQPHAIRTLSNAQCPIASVSPGRRWRQGK